MFVWILRDKGSEWRAAESFLVGGSLPFHPVVEAVCEPFLPQPGRAGKSPTAAMEHLAGRLRSLSRSGRVWIDLGNLNLVFPVRDVIEMLEVVRRTLGTAAPLVVPVVRASSDPLYAEAAVGWARGANSGICLRVDGLTSLGAKAAVFEALVRDSALSPDSIDLIADAQDLPLATSHEEIVAAFPIVEGARSWTVAAGTFPPSVTGLSPEVYHHQLERLEWLAYVEEMRHEPKWRPPLYGDYATQPALYQPSPAFRASPTVRYTTGKDYVVLRGRGGEGQSFDQFIGHARYLLTQDFYSGVIQTPDDAYIRKIATGAHGTGNATTWRVASLQRHVAVVAEQMRALALSTGVTPGLTQVRRGEVRESAP